MNPSSEDPSLLTAGRLVGGDALLFRGGVCDIETLERLVEDLSTTSRDRQPSDWWRFAEWTHRMRLQEVEHDRERDTGDDGCRCGWWPSDTHLLERARWFGPGGDLEAVRETDRFRWRFVGPRDALGLEGIDDGSDFFDDGALLRVGEEEAALLWDAPASATEIDGDARIRHAAAVDARTLALLTEMRRGQERRRVRVRYRALYDRGVVAAAWLLGLETAEASDDAGDAED